MKFGWLFVSTWGVFALGACSFALNFDGLSGRESDASLRSDDLEPPDGGDRHGPISYARAGYTVGGTISGLHGTVSLQNNGGDTLDVSTNGAFVFSKPLMNGQEYLVTVSTHPSGQTCDVRQEKGTIEGANVATVHVTCAALDLTRWVAQEAVTRLTHEILASWTRFHGALGLPIGSVERTAGGERVRFQYGWLSVKPGEVVHLRWEDEEEEIPFRGYLNIAVGGYHVCGLKSDGSSQCWGSNEHGQAPERKAGPYRQLTAGHFHTCGLKPDGAAECWGESHFGAAIASKIGPYRRLAAGGGHTCALKPDGAAECWGFDLEGDASKSKPGPYRQIAAGGGHTCALKPDGAVECWGYNTEGQASPNGRAGPYRQIAAGDWHTCGLLLTDDSVRCWGYNSHGQAPERMAGPYRQLTAGAMHTCGLTEGFAKCWGDGQTSESRAGPYRQLAAGHFHTCGLLIDSSAKCWGSIEGVFTATE